jgi:uncharacterized delta-60 repeat protein
MFFYSRFEKYGRAYIALFAIIAITALSVFAQDAKPQPAPADDSFLGTRYDSAGYANSIRNLRSRPAGIRSGLSPAVGGVDTLFNPVMDSAPGAVRATAIQPDGKILVGGYFRTLNGTRYSALVRLNADYSVDPTFTADVNGTVLSIALQADGKILIGGVFTAVSGIGQNFIARLYDHGGVDTTFNTSGGASDIVYDIAVQPDGKIVIGGSFIMIGGEYSPYAARLNSDGSKDPGFASVLPLPTPPSFFPSIVYSVAVQPDGKIILGGFIAKTTFPTPQTVASIMRLQANGSIDDTFDTGAMNSNAYKVAVLPDGKILASGFFSTVAGVSRGRIARFNNNGSLDTSFDPGAGFNGPVFTFSLRPNGSVLAGGLFYNFNGVSLNDVALVKADGTLDTTFVQDVFSTGSIYTTLTGGDGRILIGGSVQLPTAGRDSLALLSPTGALDTGFTMNSTAKGGTRAIVVQPDGKMIVGGTFTRVNGTAHTRIVRFNANGTIDPSFDTSLVGINQLTTLLLQPDGKILVGGTNIYRTSIGQTTPVPVARLNADGSWDTSFAMGNIPARTGKALAIQPDGKILFSYTIPVLGAPWTGSISRLNTDGSVDGSFDGLDLPFESIIPLPDGKILAGGPFGMRYVSSQTGSEPHIGMFRLNANGSHDRTFQSGLIADEGVAGASAVYTFERLPDGKILVGGSLYTSTTSSSPVAVARLDPEGSIDNTFQLNTISSAYEFPRVEDLQVMPNGKIIAGGLFSNIGGFSQSNIARLNSNGGFDQSFAANTDGTVFEVEADSAGKVLVGGDFENVNGTARTGLARLLSEPVVHRTPYDFDGDGKSDVSLFRPSEGNWYLLQSTAGFHFGNDSDKIAPADYDGDGKTDFAVYRSPENTWYIQNSTTGFVAANFGVLEDIPQSGDYNGDGKAEIAVWRPSEGNWYTMDPATGVTTGFHFGTTGDKPVVGDYDGDGKMDYAVYRPSEGNWYLLQSTAGFSAFHFGVAEDKPVPADYDGDGKTDFGVFRPSEGNWYLMKSTEGFTAFHWGLSTDLPTPADYDGDGKADIAVFRDGQWYLQQTAAGYTVVNFGLAGDKPAPNALVY